MKLKTYVSAAVFLAFPLTACAVPATPKAADNVKKTAVQKFSCQNGLSVSIRTLNTDKIELALDDKRAILTIDTAASGSLYTAKKGLFGRGAEWHQKGNSAFFSFTDPYGNQVDTSCDAM